MVEVLASSKRSRGGLLLGQRTKSVADEVWKRCDSQSWQETIETGAKSGIAPTLLGESQIRVRSLGPLLAVRPCSPCHAVRLWVRLLSEGC